MLHGSGPLDRNENMKGQALDIFNTLAGELAGAGFASLRYDKRGCGASEGDYYKSGHSEHLSDAHSWTDALMDGRLGRPRRVYLLGHSLGTLIGAQIAQRNSAIAGLIQLCPFIAMLEPTLRRQAATMQAELARTSGMLRFFVSVSTFLFGSPVKNQEKLIHRLKTRNEDYFRAGFQKIEARNLRELMAIDPAEQYRGLRLPVFLFGGEKDIQCDPEDCHRIAELLGDNATVHIETNLSHILRKDARPASFYGYLDQLQHPPDPAVAERVIGWLRQQTGNRAARG
jgi:pimeloyl-ACP methyl ester carboxylesterase